jgi:hypothetical protein
MKTNAWKWNNFVDKFFFSERFGIFAGFVLIFTLLTMLLFLFISYRSYINSKQEQLAATAKKIDYVLNDAFNDTNRLMVYIGKHIDKSNYKNLNFIHSLLLKTSGREYKSLQILSWTKFDWVDTNNLQTVNYSQGVAKKPISMAHREYTWKCREHPWILQFSSIAIGVLSGTWVIPAGIGITDEDNELLGMLVVGFSIAELTAMLIEKTNEEKINTIVTDNDFNIIINTNSSNFLQSQDPQQKKLLNTEAVNGPAGLLHNPILRDNMTYMFYKKMGSFPYVIFVGIDYPAFIKDFFAKIFLPIMQILSMGLFSTFLIYISRKKIIDIGRNSEQAKDDFAARINHRLGENLDKILQYSKILIRFLNGEIRVGIDNKRQLEFLSQIYKSASVVRNIDDFNLDLSTFDLNKLIKNSMEIHLMTALQKNISMNSNLHPSSLLFNGDVLYIRQIIVSLLSFSLDCAHLGSNINLITCLEHESITLKIIYSGLKLNIDDMQRIKNAVDEDNLHLDLHYVIKLVHMHGGRLDIANTNSNNTIYMSFPVMQCAPSSNDDVLLS